MSGAELRCFIEASTLLLSVPLIYSLPGRWLRCSCLLYKGGEAMSFCMLIARHYPLLISVCSLLTRLVRDKFTVFLETEAIAPEKRLFVLNKMSAFYV